MSNRFRVPREQWVKWSDHARWVFNEVFETMKFNQKLFLHPKQEPASKTHWSTTAWNAAWTAADAVDSRPKR